MSGSALSSVVRLAVTVAGYAFGGPLGGIAAGLVASMVFKEDVPGTKSTSSEPSAQTVRSSKAAARFILGRASTGGVFAWAQEQAGGQGDGEWLHLVYVLHEGTIAGVDEVYLNEELISTYGTYASYEVIINPTAANAFLLKNSPSWLQSQIGRGLSFIRVSLRYNGEKFPSGIPTLRCVVRGAADVYDPRGGISGYSDNTALHILWFLRARCGVPDDEIAMATFAAAANVCDERVTNPGGTTSKRYSTGAVIGADEARTDVLPKLVKSCAGSLTRVGGLWSLQAGAYYGPFDFTVTEDMVIGTITGTTEVSNDNAINTARGTFVDPTQAWADTDYPEVSVAEWIAEDGGESSETLSFPYVTDAYQGQRLANIELRRRRAGGSIKIPMDYNGYNCRPGRIIKVHLPSLNISGEMEVTDWQMSYDSACIVTVRTYSAEIFDDAVGQPYNPLGFINLPSGGLGAVTDLTWTPAEDAEVIQGVLSWTPPAQTVLSYTVSIRSGKTVVQALKVGGDAFTCNVNGLDSGDYTMSVTAFGAGTKSGEATITVDIDGPPAPEVCAVFSGNLELTLVPSSPGKGLNGGTYEFYYSLDPVANGLQAQYVGSGLTLTHTGLAFATSYHYYIRAINAYGSSGFLHVVATTSSQVGELLRALEGQISGTELSKDLNEKITGIEDQIAALDGLAAYKPDEPYALGDMVVQDGRIYQATKAVPEGTAPPDPGFWIDVGQSIQAANGLAQQVQKNTADIDATRSEAGAVQTLRAAYRADNGEGDLNDALKMWDTQAAYSKEVVVRAAQNEAQAKATETIQASVANTNATVQTVSQAVATLDGKVSSTYTIKVQASLNGAYEVAGIGLGVDNASGVLQSQIVFRANQFAFASPKGDGTVSYPYIISGGVNYFNTAFFQDASISFLKVGDNVQSNNFVPGSTGWRLAKDGTFEINGAVAGQGRMTMTNRALKVFDANNVLRVQLGDLTA